MLAIDLSTRLRGDILVKADKITMANSLSCGCRSWTRRFRGGFRRPAAKITRTTTGIALRRAGAHLCLHTLHRPKLGFPVPIRHWLRAGELLEGVCDGGPVAGRSYFWLTRRRVSLDEHRCGSDHSRRLWTMLDLYAVARDLRRAQRGARPASRAPRPKL